jgi:ATP-dependent Zn protease
VLIGCERFADVPEPLRRVSDLVLTLPRIDAAAFVEIFQAMYDVAPPAGWDQPDGGAWTRHLLHTDFHALVGVDETPSEAVAYLRERCESRIRQVSADDSLQLRDLHGLGEARRIAEDLIDDIADATAGEIPWTAVDRGMLLAGPPGTGKTTLARAIARDCGVKFIQASATHWQSAGALDEHLKAIRQTFAEARRYAPSILFIDEIDSIGNRELLSGHNAVYQTDVINAVLEQIQGLDPEHPVVVIGATNFVERVDPALRRPGRLDQVVIIERPTVPALVEIFKQRLAPLRGNDAVAADVDEEMLARLAFGATGADIEQFVRGATRRARKQRRNVNQADLVAEVTRRPRSPDSAVRLGPDDLQRVAVHEAGHALVSMLGSSKGAELTYISVIPRLDGTLGFVASAPPTGASLTRRQCVERLEVMLGGRAAEELWYGEHDVGLGAGGGESSDLAAATRLATMLVCTSGLGDDGSLLWSEQPNTAQLAQVDGLLRDAYTSVRTKLELNRPVLEKIASILVAEQELDGDALRSFVATGEEL